MSSEWVRNSQDILTMLDSIVTGTPGFWDKFYADRGRKVPFFVNAPDENLAAYLNSGWIQSKGRALDLGCGAGRNALFLAQKGYVVDAVDYSAEAINWAQERAAVAGSPVNFICKSVFELAVEEPYDLIYDSGCLHHLLPHRRVQYLKFIRDSLKKGGYLGLTCFAPGYPDVGGPVREMSDWDVYRERTMNGGLAFSEPKLRGLFAGDYENIEFRKMVAVGEGEDLFGVEFLWTSLWRKL
jgi:SAM-dependent methyltransferase